MDVLDTQSQSKYISIIVRELSKSLDSATWGAFSELLRVIKFVIDIKSFGLKVQPRLDNILG
jgi:hypothetical protein